MAELRKNHFIPKSVLKYWIDPETPHQGIHVYDIAKKRVYVSTGAGSTPFSFAIGRDLYVHTATGTRAVGLEKWFSGLESSLASLSRQAHDRVDEIKLGVLANWTKALMAVVSLECRSPYVIRKMEKALQDNPSLREIISPDATRPVQQQVLENIIHQVSERVAAVTPVALTFLHAPEGKSWVVSDRPYFNDGRLPQRFVVLTNKVLLVYERGSSAFMYQHQTATVDFNATINHQLAVHAREWLAADSRSLLDEYVPVIGSEEWLESVASETIDVDPVRYLTSSWTIDR